MQANEIHAIARMPTKPICTLSAAPRAMTTAPPTPPTTIVTAPMRPEAVPAFARAALSKEAKPIQPQQISEGAKSVQSKKQAALA